ncbi:MAG TPA: hypothetical protein VJ608_11275 [Albitalea sp.]|nr:hypothetical protein [Albitalea sp.]
MANATLLSTRDPRFGSLLEDLLTGCGSAAGNLDRLVSAARMKGTPVARRAAEGLIAAMGDAEALMVGAEMEAIALASLGHSWDPRRSADMVLSRFGTDGQDRSLQQVGDLFGVSRQTVCSTIQLALSACPRSAYAPATRQLVDVVRTLACRTRAEIEEAARPLLGTDQSLEGALRFAYAFLALACPLSGQRDLSVEKRRGMPAAAQDMPRATVLAFARATVGAVGACHWSTVVALVGEELPGTVNRGLYESAIDGHPHAIWLDRSRGWATFADVPWPVLDQVLRGAKGRHSNKATVPSITHLIAEHLRGRTELDPDNQLLDVIPPLRILIAAVTLRARSDQSRVAGRLMPLDLGDMLVGGGSAGGPISRSVLVPAAGLCA